MLSAIMLGWTVPLLNCVRHTCSELEDVWIYKTIEETGSAYELGRALAAYEPQVIFLEIPSPDSEPRPLSAIVQQVYAQAPGTAIVPFCRVWDKELAEIAAGLGLPQPLAPPFSAEQFEDAIIAALRPPAANRGGSVVAFVPSRPGSGATTVSLNTAYALAATYGRKVLLIETDDYAGALATLLPPDGAALDAVREPHPTLTAYSWKRYVQALRGVDVLPGATTQAVTGGNRWTFRQLLGLARSEYDSVLLNVSRLTDPRLKIMAREAGKFCLVCSPDAAGIAMTSRRVAELVAAGVETSRIMITLNRCSSSAAVGRMEASLGMRVSAVLPDAPGVVVDSYANRQGLVPGKSALGKAVVKLAARLGGVEDPSPLGRKWRLSFLARAFAPEERVKVAS